jgi:hypothetical protein
MYQSLVAESTNEVPDIKCHHALTQGMKLQLATCPKTPTNSIPDTSQHPPPGTATSPRPAPQHPPTSPAHQCARLSRPTTQDGLPLLQFRRPHHRPRTPHPRRPRLLHRRGQHLHPRQHAGPPAKLLRTRQPLAEHASRSPAAETHKPLSWTCSGLFRCYHCAEVCGSGREEGSGEYVEWRAWGRG